MTFFPIRDGLMTHSPWALLVDAGLLISRALTTETANTRSTLSSKGVTYSDGKLSVRTDRVAPSREEYIASTQRAFEQGAKKMSLHPDAFRHGPSQDSNGGMQTTSAGGGASAVDTP
ncbi:MAG: hypothetical protein TREMPRED_005799 [Tremellales sp. Tagirdzhanova-0007]|nr:MAG: hypothetical protein TREMPRED_005799 [Tremellales sp. Tagirdzhanova-0007]